MRKLAVDNLTDGEIVKFSLEILKGGPLIATQIATDILTRTGKTIAPRRIGHILANHDNLFDKGRPGPRIDGSSAWTWSLPNWVLPPKWEETGSRSGARVTRGFVIEQGVHS